MSDAMLCLQSLCPHVVVGSEVRYYVGNYSTFLRHASMDWEGQFVTELRGGRGCAICARWFWLEEMWPVHLAGEQCFNMFGAGSVVHVFGICIKLREDVQSYVSEQATCLCLLCLSFYILLIN